LSGVHRSKDTAPVRMIDMSNIVLVIGGTEDHSSSIKAIIDLN